MNAPKSTKAPRPAPRTKPRASAHEPPQGEQTEAEGVAAPAASPVDRSPEKSNSAAAKGSPVGAAPSTPAAAPRMLRLYRVTLADAPNDLDALLRDVGRQCERACSGDLSIAVLTAQRVARGEPWSGDEMEPDALAEALAFVLAALVDDIEGAAKLYRASVATLAASRRNDDGLTIERRFNEMRADRANLARVAHLAGRVAAAVVAAEE